MRIAQVPPLYESVPPKLYGGTERVVSYLTDELVRQGHEVTLFGTGDSITQATLHPVCDQAIRLNEKCKDPMAYHIYQLQVVQELAHQFDIIHFHTDYLHFPLSRLGKYNHITTLHGRLDLEELRPIYKKFHDMPVVSISRSQQRPLPFANWAGTVHHGLPLDLYQQGAGHGGYVAFLGRISPEKGPDRAIEIAKRAGIPLKMAAKVDKADLQYFQQHIEPLLDHPLIEFIGEIGEKDKGAFLGNALALLFPIYWPEPFGMVMIEAMANGTPVVAFPHGSVPEVIQPGVNGFIVHSVEEAVKALRAIHRIDRSLCRSSFESFFSARVMAEKYVILYERLVRKRNIFCRASSDLTVSGRGLDRQLN